MNIRNFLTEKPQPLNEEKCYIGKEWWYASTLIEASKDLEPYDLHLDSLDLGVWPWSGISILRFLQEVICCASIDLTNPVIMTASGWVMNGWHRICKAILDGEETIKTVRLLKLPEPDGRED